MDFFWSTEPQSIEAHLLALLFAHLFAHL